MMLEANLIMGIALKNWLQSDFYPIGQRKVMFRDFDWLQAEILFEI